ncbi:MAG: 1-phosphofructokinase family hexose kinase [Microbacteriaceae bacterium]
MITVLLLSPALDVTYRIDSMTAGEIHRPREVIRLPGGKGLNLARAATRLGATVRVVAPLGGHMGEFVASLAAAAGVDVVVVPVRGETRSCVTVAVTDGTLTEFYEPSTPLNSAEVAAVATALAVLDAPSGWTTLSGSVPATVPLPDLVVMLKSRADAGDRIAIDTHGDALKALISQVRPHLVKVNRFEASELLGASEDAAALELALGLRALSGGAVVVTDGSAGSVAVDATGQWRVTLDVAPGNFAVGSGDSYLGGILTVLDRGGSLREALALATGAAAANASIPGAAEFDRTRALQLTQRTKVEVL